MKEPSKRTAPEWVTLTVSLVLLAATMGTVLYAELTRGSRPPSVVIEARIESLAKRSGAHYLPLTVRNTGDETAADVGIRISLLEGGAEKEWTTLTLDYLPGGAEEKATVVFDRDPSGAQVAFDVSFSEP